MKTPDLLFHSLMRSVYTYLLLPSVFLLHSCNNQDVSANKEPEADSTAADSMKHVAANAMKDLVVATGLQAETMATEPMLKNPTNIDVDERGRVWVTEAFNYRPAINGNPVNPEGDRIMILEDKNGDGHADTAKVFYQGPEINAPLGICVLGKKVLVSQSPYVWAFYDDDGDDRADRKEIMFQGIGGVQHDHGMHTFIFGPDGKLYFSFGNEGKTLKDKNGKTVLDQDGDEIGPKKYQMGMIFRCNPDGSHVECLAQNFRNNYELAVDSYGTIWQSDNDDDGNRGVRINYVMQYGNYGYRDEMTGAGWQASRTNMEDSIPLRHWHLNDPGVVPNLLQTGAGSPTGMIIYEGNLLPGRFRNQMIHCDAGVNVVRSYPVAKDGAGYKATITNILKNEKDQWFRPADVCAAPDGSIIVADWYDPGVGGHQAGDQQRGRIYRVTIPGKNYTIPAFDYANAADAVKALQNPNLAVRYHAWTALHELGAKAVPELNRLWHSSADAHMRARAFWVLANMPGGNKYIEEALKDPNPDIRITALRAARQLNADVIGSVNCLVNDPDPQVRRECALTLHHRREPQAAALWAQLAAQYHGNDRWNLEALGIGADAQWNSFFHHYIQQVRNPLQDDGGKDIVWRARCEETIPFLAQLASNENESLKSRLRYFRAFDFNEGPAKSGYLLKMLETNGNNLELNKLVLHHLDKNAVMRSGIAQRKMKEVLNEVKGTQEYVDLVSRYEVKTENPQLLALAVDHAGQSLGRDAAALLLKQGGEPYIQKMLSGTDTISTQKLLSSLGRVGSKESISILEHVALSRSTAMAIRSKAAEMMGKSMSGEDRILELLKTKKIPEPLIPSAVAGVKSAWRKSIYLEALTYLPGADKSVAAGKMPEFREVLALQPDVSKGKETFSGTCSVCHQVNKEGYDFGPRLSEIGSKLPKEALFEAIVHPSAGIGVGYETSELRMKDGSKLTGIVSSKTETEIDVKFPGGVVQKIKASDVQSIKQLPVSMMPEGLYQALSTQQLSNLLGYLSSLKKK
jgi:putative membrane-bound dehydrogenase-like protein